MLSNEKTRKWRKRPSDLHSDALSTELVVRSLRKPSTLLQESIHFFQPINEFLHLRTDRCRHLRLIFIGTTMRTVPTQRSDQIRIELSTCSSSSVSSNQLYLSVEELLDLSTNLFERQLFSNDRNQFIRIGVFLWLSKAFGDNFARVSGVVQRNSEREEVEGNEIPTWAHRQERRSWNSDSSNRRESALCRQTTLIDAGRFLLSRREELQPGDHRDRGRDWKWSVSHRLLSPRRWCWSPVDILRSLSLPNCSSQRKRRKHLQRYEHTVLDCWYHLERVRRPCPTDPNSNIRSNVGLQFQMIRLNSRASRPLEDRSSHLGLSICPARRGANGSHDCPVYHSHPKQQSIDGKRPSTRRNRVDSIEKKKGKEDECSFYLLFFFVLIIVRNVDHSRIRHRRRSCTDAISVDHDSRPSLHQRRRVEVRSREFRSIGLSDRVDHHLRGWIHLWDTPKFFPRLLLDRANGFEAWRTRSCTYSFFRWR